MNIFEQLENKYPRAKNIKTRVIDIDLTGSHLSSLDKIRSIMGPLYKETQPKITDITLNSVTVTSLENVHMDVDYLQMCYNTVQNEIQELQKLLHNIKTEINNTYAK